MQQETDNAIPQHMNEMGSAHETLGSIHISDTQMAYLYGKVLQQ